MRRKLSERLHPIDEWCIVEAELRPEMVARGETLFATSNGYLGLRGDFEEGTPASSPGAFVNGFYESWPIVYGEEAFGFAKDGQTIVNVTDGKTVRLFVDDEIFEPSSARLASYRRCLDMRRGVVERDLQWDTPAGKRVRIRSRRFASLFHRHLAVVEYEVMVRNAAAHVTLVSEIATRRLDAEEDGDPRRVGHFDGRVLTGEHQRSDEARLVLAHRTRRSGLRIACGVDHVLDAERVYSRDASTAADRGNVTFSLEAEPNRPIRLAKMIAYHTSDGSDAEELCDRTERTLDRAISTGVVRLAHEQEQRVAAFWDRADVRVHGHPRIQQAVRFNLFQLLQATARADGLGVPAKGLTGPGYEGHYFWDCEAYVLPFVVYTAPEEARSLLGVRYAMLDNARGHARLLGHQGALFPWRTINGEEASAYYAAGTAQYHIDADVAHAVCKYADVTGDTTFLHGDGAEILVETARFWVALGCYPPSKPESFCLNDVTGPDEYTAMVDNNRYTNFMARRNLRRAVRVVEHLRANDERAYDAVAERTGLDIAELEDWRRAASRMYLVVDPANGIHPQDDSFLDKEVWDFQNTPPEKYPLLLHYHPLTLYRHQVIKQADVVMALFLLGDEFTREEKQRNFEYYDPLTTRDSSLSSCIQSIVAAEVGKHDLAYEYFEDALFVDLTDANGNVKDGVHVASAGGAWMGLVYGFGGLRDHGGGIAFEPNLPSQWRGLSFSLCVRDTRFSVELTHEHATYRWRDGPPLEIRHRSELIRLSADEPERSARRA